MGTRFGPSWPRLAQWSSTGFLVSGAGLLSALVLGVVNELTAVSVSEVAFSAVVLPSFLVLSLFALPGFYPYVAEGSPRLALAGGVAAGVTAATIVFQLVGKTVLHLVGAVGFTEEGPLLIGFFIWLLAFFVSVVLYGLASLYGGEPSRLVGALLLVIALDPTTSLLNDALALDLGVAVLYASVGIAGVSMLAIGASLRGITRLTTDSPAGSETTT